MYILYLYTIIFHLSKDNEKPILPCDAQHWFLQQTENILHENKPIIII